MAHKLEELPVFSHAEDFTVAVTATLRRSRVRKDCDTYKQIVEANDSILANMQCKMLGGLIKYLKRSGFKDRGRFKASQQDKED
jgi:hypothetical protein